MRSKCRETTRPETTNVLKKKGQKMSRFPHRDQKQEEIFQKMIVM